MIATYQIVVLRADGGNAYRRNKGEKLEDASPGDERRSFLRKAAVTALGREVAELVPDPPEPLRLDRARPNYFLVLSNSCSTCQTIGSGLAAPASRWESAITVPVASDSERYGQEWAASVGLDSPRVFLDDQGKYAKQLGVSSSPTVVRVERGRLTAAANLTSLRQLEVFVDGSATN